MSEYGDTVTHLGYSWRRVDTLPRLLAEGWRRELTDGCIASALLTPDGWSVAAPVYEVIAGSYLGDVGLYVPEVQYAEALELLGIEEE
ncbi:hypothetical protein [Deinococcus radiophilus]|uniref:Uncharacterized protein n=1 Tax=Deinococcus radiophilus TaxID=32062 RepID=A0A431W0H5_9DEIO|nr:hypothetical protein [Deinococcus radiophilus]RTR29017.1 hypothetical protein EJ104_04010 [Deinococcus radiophilus]UFA49602.1 hypothetical protein LMT64_06760 [Deinococcus radiophilus]